MPTYQILVCFFLSYVKVWQEKESTSELSLSLFNTGKHLSLDLQNGLVIHRQICQPEAGQLCRSQDAHPVVRKVHNFVLKMTLMVPMGATHYMVSPVRMVFQLQTMWLSTTARITVFVANGVTI